jgi:hypothetical protein
MWQNGVLIGPLDILPLKLIVIQLALLMGLGD